MFKCFHQHFDGREHFDGRQPCVKPHFVVLSNKYSNSSVWVPSLIVVGATWGSLCVEECANSLLLHFALCPSQKLSVSIPSLSCSSVISDVLAPDSKCKSQMRSPLCSRSFLFFVAFCFCCSIATFLLLVTLSDLSTEALKSFDVHILSFLNFGKVLSWGWTDRSPWWKWRPQNLSVSRIFFSVVSPRPTALIHLSLLFLVSSSYYSSCSMMILGIRKNPRPLCVCHYWIHTPITSVLFMTW